MKKIWILNDLFASADYRKKGIGQLLIDHGKETGRKKVVLSTAHDNINAQKLYEKLGFTRSDFYNYEITV